MSANPKVVEAATHKFDMVINGKLTPGAATLDVINPATGKVLMTCARANQAQVEEAIAAAKAAFPAWSKKTWDERRQLLTKIVDVFATRIDEFAKLSTQESGKPLPLAIREMKGAVASLRNYAQLDLPVETLKASEAGRIIKVRAPLGVVAAITAWNYPITLLVNKMPPALLAGNTIVVKPAPTTPLTTLLFGVLCNEILPPGVMNVVVDNNDLGHVLTQHPDVAKVAFTGSTATGKKVMASAADTVKRVTLELGGNDPAIVMQDADVKEIAPKILQGALVNAGQVCLAIKRVYVHESQYDLMCDELAKLAKQIVVGDGLDKTTQMGPLQNKMQFEKVKEFLEDAKANGKIIAGGNAIQRDGYFIEPTVVRDLPDHARLVREEQFGPIIPVLKYTDINDAIKRANDTSYGLGATVWGKNVERASEVAMQLEAGTIWVNKHLDLPPEVPFGGAKQSGLGVEKGLKGLEEFTQARIINIGV
ncbi:MAG TPA: aldehyde dehydrogenase family protein [Steroidobacteraceae bacterium]|nr:aldehyde dehydrogenase family protein [Steroidobacteraceae bacterium]